MAENELEIVKNGEYNNLNLKTKFKRAQGNLVLDAQGEKQVFIEGIANDSSITVEKVMKEGYENISKTLKDYNKDPLKSYSCKVKYKGEECSFWLSVDEHDIYKELGGIGDFVKITAEGRTSVNKKTGAKSEYQELVFEKV